MPDTTRGRVWRGGLFVVALVAATGSIAFAALPSWATFTATTSASSTMSAKRIFSGTRTVIAHNLHDFANGSDTDASDPVSATDTLKDITGNWSSTFSTTRYVEMDLDAPNPAGLATTAVTFDLGYADSKGGAGDQVCFYFDVRRISTGAVLGTFGSAAATLGCNIVTTASTTHTSIQSVVPSTDVANDLRVRVYMTQTKNSAAFIDLATVSVTTADATRTDYAERYIDQSTGTANDLTWGVGSADAFSYTAKANWGNTYSSTKYLSYTFPSSIPTGATITGVTLNHSYRPSGAATLCNYVEVYSGATLLASHGSSTADVSCNASTTAFVTDPISLPEVNSVPAANATTVRIYYKASAGRTSQDDLVTMSITYSLT